MAPETRTLTVKLNVEFEFDKADVRAIYGDELEAVANAMKVHEDITLELEGHTLTLAVKRAITKTCLCVVLKRLKPRFKRNMV